ncbi:MAG: uncharacterized protein KVP18_003004 [Porospora cf. gigantea A]|uniref:uncharacterized protein n=1 Tax=Porospora cf. gigantea A TaxID=2853593 RepID=UPI003559ED8B|nr:MAG: hypothetical protein KVP18_003004 [Porospora cf. gigantea A]
MDFAALTALSLDEAEDEFLYLEERKPEILRRWRTVRTERFFKSSTLIAVAATSLYLWSCGRLGAASFVMGLYAVFCYVSYHRCGGVLGVFSPTQKPYLLDPALLTRVAPHRFHQRLQEASKLICGEIIQLRQPIQPLDQPLDQPSLRMRTQGG